MCNLVKYKCVRMERTKSKLLVVLYCMMYYYIVDRSEIDRLCVNKGIYISLNERQTLSPIVSINLCFREIAELYDCGLQIG